MQKKCATCLEYKGEKGKTIYGLYICEKCIYKILTIHIYTNNIKWLCPMCDGDINKKCEFCDLTMFLKELKCL